MYMSVEQFNALIIYIDDNIDYKRAVADDRPTTYGPDNPAIGKAEYEMLKSYDALYNLLVER